MNDHDPRYDPPTGTATPWEGGFVEVALSHARMQRLIQCMDSLIATMRKDTLYEDLTNTP